MKSILFILLVALCVPFAGCSKEERPAAKNAAISKEGTTVPDFTLKDLSGKAVTLSSLRGKVVLLNFWATWCPPCREEIPSMMKLQKSMQGKPFEMLAVSIDEGGAPDVEAFFKKSGFSLPVLIDTEHTVSTQYGITGVPETFIVDVKGTLVKKVIGPMDWNSPDVIRFLTDLTAK